MTDPHGLGRVPTDAQLPIWGTRVTHAETRLTALALREAVENIQRASGVTPLTPHQQGQRKGRDGADDAVQHIPPSILAQMHTTMRGFVGRTFIADFVRAELPEAAKLWLDGNGHANAWGGWWQRCYVATGLIIRTGRHFPALRKVCRGRLQPEWCFASDVTPARFAEGETPA